MKVLKDEQGATVSKASRTAAAGRWRRAAPLEQMPSCVPREDAQQSPAVLNHINDAQPCLSPWAGIDSGCADAIYGCSFHSTRLERAGIEIGKISMFQP